MYFSSSTEGIFDATGKGAVCPYPNAYAGLIDLASQEDCLILNVYNKDVDSHVPKKVMVFIHGGAYIFGSSTEYQVGSFVTSEDVIIVTINYRLGVLGFLSTGDDSCPGNFGLWDMTLALQWVRDNIASFGGDPTDVTISGESAGGSAVGYLSISPHTKGLFTKAYLQSGTPTSAFGRFLDPRKATLELAIHLNCFDKGSSAGVSSEETKEIVQCLRHRHVSNFTSFPLASLDNVQFVPTVDGDFIPKSPAKLLQDDEYLNNVGFFQRSYLVGINNNENFIYKRRTTAMFNYISTREDLTDDAKINMISELQASAVTFSIKTRLGKDIPTVAVEKIVDWYDRRFGNDTIWQLMGDLSFLVPTFDFINAASRGPNNRVWLFYFNHYPKYMQGSNKGVIHAADLAYWFDFDLAILDTFKAGIDLDIGMIEEDAWMKSLLSSIIGDFTNTG